jgi:hypothetical protein
MNINSLKIELDKKRWFDIVIKWQGNLPKNYTRLTKNRDISLLQCPINLYLDGKKILAKGLPEDDYTSDIMFFASIPHKKEFDLIKQKKEQYEVDMVDGFFRFYLKFRDNGENVSIKVEFVDYYDDVFIEMKTSDLFSQFDQMWTDLVDVLYEVYPKELVDREMNKIYQEVDERVARGEV